MIFKRVWGLYSILYVVWMNRRLGLHSDAFKRHSCLRYVYNVTMVKATKVIFPDAFVLLSAPEACKVFYLHNNHNKTNQKQQQKIDFPPSHIAWKMTRQWYKIHIECILHLPNQKNVELWLSSARTYFMNILIGQWWLQYFDPRVFFFSFFIWLNEWMSDFFSLKLSGDIRRW